MTGAEHYEGAAAEAGELARLRAEVAHLKYLLAGAVPLSQHDVIVSHYRQALERIAKPATGYLTWHVTEAVTALATAPGQTVAAP